IDVDHVADHLGIFAFRQRIGRNARRAMLKACHSVEEMGEAAATPLERATNFLRRSDAVSYLHAAAGLAQSLDDAAAARNFGRDSRNCDPISPRPSRCKFRVSFPEKADVHRPRPLRVEERTFEM